MKFAENGLTLFIVIPVLCTFIAAIVFVGVGVEVAISAVKAVLAGDIHTGSNNGIKLIEMLDLFMVAFMFFVIGLGFSKLFLPSSFLSRFLDRLRPSWLNVSNFTELKMLLWEVLLTAIVIVFVGDVYMAEGHYNWTMLLIPSAILLLSASMFLIKKGDKKVKPDSEG